MVIHRVFSASSFFFFYIYLYKIYLIMHGEGSSESKQESGVYKKKIPVPFARVRYRTVNQTRKRIKKFPVRVSSESVSLPGSARIRIKN